MPSIIRSLFIILMLSSAALAAEYPLAPDFTMTSAAGDEIRLSSEAEAQTTVVMFWATWCPYCKALMPHLQSLQLELGNDVKILAITIREDGDPEALLRENAYNFTLLNDGDAIADEFGVRGTPSVYVIDREGRIRFDLATVQRRELPPSYKGDSNAAKAAFRAPLWAAEIRKSVRAVMSERDSS